MILEAEPDLTVVGEAADGLEALEMVPRGAARRRADGRADAADGRHRGLRPACGPTPTAPCPYVLMLTTFDLEDYVYAALRAGASGFLLKDAPADQLVAAIEIVARGDALLAPQVTRLLIEEVARPARRSTPSPGLDRLTEREVEVLRLMARGLSNAEIAGELYLGEATIKTHVGRVLTKLSARDRVQAVVAAYESGLVDTRRRRRLTPLRSRRRRTRDPPRGGRRSTSPARLQRGS